MSQGAKWADSEGDPGSLEVHKTQGGNDNGNRSRTEKCGQKLLTALNLAYPSAFK